MKGEVIYACWWAFPVQCELPEEGISFRFRLASFTFWRPWHSERETLSHVLAVQLGVSQNSPPRMASFSLSRHPRRIFLGAGGKSPALSISRRWRMRHMPGAPDRCEEPPRCLFCDTGSGARGVRASFRQKGIYPQTKTHRNDMPSLFVDGKPFSNWKWATSTHTSKGSLSCLGRQILPSAPGHLRGGFPAGMWD